MSRMRFDWLWWVCGALVAAAVGWSFVPQPTSVDVVRVARGSLAVTVDEDGRTRVCDRYTVAAPVSGHLQRIAYRAGATVKAGQIVATLLASPPPPIDARTRSQLDARVEAAVDALRQARTRAESVRASLAQARLDHDRLRQLERDRVASPQELEVARTREQMAQAEVDGGDAGVGVAEHELQAARAALFEAHGRANGPMTAIRAPRDGAILRVFEESERVVAAGTPLVEIGAPDALEIVADLLSTDAVQVKPGARVLIERWGGDAPLHGRVRLVEPHSYTKVSALGVEEQRVNVVVDFTDGLDVRRSLGDGYAVDIRVVIWDRDGVVKVPVSTLFRRGDGWSVYKVIGGRAVEQRVRLGRQNDLEAMVEQGLAEGEMVIVHPSERIADGARVAVR